MFTSEVLNKAADLIQQRGWVKGPSGWGDGPNDGLCLEGALTAALGLPVKGANFRVQACPAYRAVYEHVATDDQWLWQWNDTRGRTATEVIEVLRAAAVIEAAREEQDAAFATYLPNVVSA